MKQAAQDTLSTGASVGNPDQWFDGCLEGNGWPCTLIWKPQNPGMSAFGALGYVTRVRPGKQIDPQKLAAIRHTKAAGESQASVSARLGLPKSTVGRLWHYPED